MTGEIEHFFTCPYCFSNISMILEVLESRQEYIEDCEVCCRPIIVSFCSPDQENLEFFAKSTNE
jgi:hypothetical protein